MHVHLPLMQLLFPRVRECSLLSMLRGPSCGTSVENRDSIVCCCNVTQGQKAQIKARRCHTTVYTVSILLLWTHITMVISYKGGQLEEIVISS